MSRMVRKQVCIDEQLDHALAEKAHRMGVSQGQIVRAALRREFETNPDDEVARVWSGIRSVLDRRDASGPLEGTRMWVRDDAYDDERGCPRGIGHRHSAR